jgi:hypothetical protein
LEDKGCIVVVEPFRQGEFGWATIELPLYAQMVKMSPAQQKSLASAHSQQEANARQSCSNPAPKPRIDTFAIR